MLSITRTVKNISRIREVITILGKHSFENVITRTGLSEFLTPQGRVRIHKSSPKITKHSQNERIRMVVEELGPTFIKFAQLLSNRPDVLPDGLITEFEKLQSKVPSFSSDIAIQIIESEIGGTIESVFSFFDKKAIGAASIGQVHRARLKNGMDVVVKVQRPRVEDVIISDLAFIHQIVSLTQNYFESLGILNPLGIVEVFEKSMLKELDYNEEAKNIEQFRHLYKNETKFYIPKAYRDISTKKVLVIEFLSGCKISDVEQLKRWGLSTKKIAENGIDSYLHQMFVHGFFHADPHPGNILIRPNGMIGLIDFGSVGRLTKRQKYAFSGTIIAMVQQDARGMASNLIKLSLTNAIKSQRAYEKDIEDLIEDFIVVNIDHLGISALTGRLQQIIYTYKLELPGSIFLLLRSLAIIEGVGHVLHPEFDTLKYLKPYGNSLLKEQYSAKNIANELKFSASQILALLNSAPKDIKSILRQVRRGEIKSNVEVAGLDVFPKVINHAANKLTLGLLSAAFTLGSFGALDYKNENLPDLLGIPFIAVIGFSVGMFFAFLVLIEIRRDNR